jgi:hypothetical protein
MKKLLVFLLPGLLLLGGGVAAASQYNRYQHKVKVATKVVADQQAALLKATQAAHASVSAQYSALHVECEKGSNAYNTLSTAIQKKIPAPVCGPVIAQ